MGIFGKTQKPEKDDPADDSPELQPALGEDDNVDDDSPENDEDDGMPLEMRTRHTEKIDPKAKIAGERMFYNDDGTMLVRDNDPKARVLAVAEGHRMHPDLVKRFRIKGGKLDRSGENKALKSTEDKGA